MRTIAFINQIGLIMGHYPSLYIHFGGIYPIFRRARKNTILYHTVDCIFHGIPSIPIRSPFDLMRFRETCDLPLDSKRIHAHPFFPWKPRWKFLPLTSESQVTPRSRWWRRWRRWPWLQVQGNQAPADVRHGFLMNQPWFDNDSLMVDIKIIMEWYIV